MARRRGEGERVVEMCLREGRGYRHGRGGVMVRMWCWMEGWELREVG